MSLKHLAALDSGKPTLVQTLSGLGLASNLQIALDAGDPASYTSGQKWLDLSGNGQDFFLGADGTASSADPTFVAGGRRSYFSFDGGDYFTYDTTNETWMDSLHKDNAAFTVAQWIFRVPGQAAGLWGDNAVGTLTNHGVDFRLAASNICQLIVANGSGVTARTISSTATAASAQWYFIAMSVDEAGNAYTFQLNSTQEAGAASYSSPSSSAASQAFNIGARGAAGTPLSSGHRMASSAIWTRALTAAELNLFFNATRGAFGV